ARDGPRRRPPGNARRRRPRQGGTEVAELPTTQAAPAAATAKPRGKPIIRLSGIKRTFWPGDTPVQVLDGLDLEVPEGSFEALMGPSGSGKSTILNLIAGLDQPTEGTVE